MSLLAPLYVAGLLALALPVVFHLIRRSPRGQRQFSSLMFLSPSPPRLTRRSRLDHLLLLFLRALALGLLAFAFTRPFLRESAQLDRAEAAGGRVAVLVDTSASMRRGDLWRQAVSTVDQIIADARPGDHLAVFAFDETLRPVVGFDELSRIAPQARRDLIAGRLQALTPSWSATHLDQALIGAIDALNDIVDATEADSRLARRIVLVSDVQQGGRTDELGGFTWPADVEVEMKHLTARGVTNAAVHGLADGRAERAATSPDTLRVRVFNAPTSQADQFQLAWIDQDGAQVGAHVPVYVPAGESRVVRVARPAGDDPPHELRLAGDSHAFDNSLFVVPPLKQNVQVVYLGNDEADDARGHRYYLKRALPDSPWRSVEAATYKSNEELPAGALSQTALVVTVGDLPGGQVEQVRQYVQSGGAMLAVVTEAGAAPGFAALLDSPDVEFQEGDVSSYTMLGQIAFDHPLFAPFAAPQFNDFTKIHFWQYRRVDEELFPQGRVLARFENDDPAWIESPLGEGRLHVLASGWRPADSQLARSTKFVPLLLALLTGGRTSLLDAAGYRVNQRVALGGRQDRPGPWTLHKPDGARVILAGDQEFIPDTNLPGIYRVQHGDDNEEELFAVNLAAAESNTAPLAAETLQQLGCRLSSGEAPQLSDQLRRQMRDVELEGRQKLWQWLVLTVVGVLIVETFVAGRLSRPSFTTRPTETVTA